MKLCEVSDVQGGAVAGQLVPMRVGDVEVLVQTIPVAGSEPTSTLGDASQRVLDAFERAHQVIVGAAGSTAKVINKLGAQGTRPQQMEVEFGLGSPRPAT
jgi:Trypsin-co-occurring domain 1